MKGILFSSVGLVTGAVPTWEEFKVEYEKVYNGVEEESHRHKIWAGKMEVLEAHNAKYDKGEKSWYMGVNQFSDWTEAEFVDRMLMKEFKSLLNTTLTGVPVVDEVHPNLHLGDGKQWDVSPVKDQGSCGAGWAFGAVAGMEGSAKKDLGSDAILSEQYVMDCTSGSGACNGGRADDAYPQLYGKPLYTQLSYPYTAEGGTCKTGADSGLRISKFIRSFPANESDSRLTLALNYNPLVVAVDPSGWSMYAGGVYRDDNLCSRNHWVYATGYDKVSITVKNSWGFRWGQNGYIRLLRTDEGCGTSGIFSEGGFFPTMSSSEDAMV